MFCMALALEDNYSDMEDADNIDVGEYRKKAKRVSKAMKKWGPAPAAPPYITPQAKKKATSPKIC